MEPLRCILVPDLGPGRWQESERFDVEDGRVGALAEQPKLLETFEANFHFFQLAEP